MANIYKSRPLYFVLALTVSEILTFQIFDLQKGGQDHGVEFSQCGTSMVIFRNLQKPIFTFLILAKMRPIVMK